MANLNTISTKSKTVENNNSTFSNTSVWSKPKGKKDNVGTNPYLETPKQMSNGDTLGSSKPSKNIYPKK